MAVRDNIISLFEAAGLASIGVGIWWISPAVSLIVLGTLVLAGAAWADLRG